MLVAEPAGGGKGLGRVEVEVGVEDCVLVHFDFGLWGSVSEAVSWFIATAGVVHDGASRKTVFWHIWLWMCSLLGRRMVFP